MMKYKFLNYRKEIDGISHYYDSNHLTNIDPEVLIKKTNLVE